jgi:hypothetical protein
MPTLTWNAPMPYFSERDEAAFFNWLQSIPGVVSVTGEGRSLKIRLRSARLSGAALREFIALYERYRGDMTELAQFYNSSNASWFKNREAYWYAKVFL